MDVITTISNALTIAQRLREIAKNVAQAEFTNLLADLAIELANAKLQVGALKEILADKEEEIRVLRAKQGEGERPTGTKWGCYQFEGDEALYCTACWDVRRTKVRAARTPGGLRHCPVCKAVMGS
jgi:hypothetical protein